MPTLEICYGNHKIDSTWLRVLKLESYTGDLMAYPAQDRSYINWRRTYMETHTWHNSWTAARIQQLIRQDRRLTICDIAEEVEVGYGTCQRVLTEVFACAVSQQHLWSESWQLTRSSSASTSALNFVSSPPTMKCSYLGSSLVMGAGFTVTTLRQSENPASGKAPRHHADESPDRWKAISRARSYFSFKSRGLCTKDLSQHVELWIPFSTEKLCGDSVKMCEDTTPKFDENRPGCFAITTPSLTLPSSPTSFWRKTKLLLYPTHCTPLIYRPVSSSYFQKWNLRWKVADSVQLRTYRTNRRECLTLTENDLQGKFQKWSRW